MKALNLAAALLSILSVQALAAPAVPKDPPVEFIYEKISDIQPAPVAGACRINVMGVNDVRPSKGQLNADMWHTTGPSEPWLKESFDALAAYGYKVEHHAGPQPGMLNLDVNLTRAYSWLADMRINGMVAMELTIQRPSGAVTEKFRGSGSKSNMWGAKTEFVTAINYALNHTLDDVAKGLVRHCSGA